MAAGLEIFDAGGNLMLGVTTYVGAFYASFSTGGAASGTHQDDRLIGRTLLHFVAETDNDFGGPDVTLAPETGTISWAYSITVNGGSAPSAPTDTIYYGGY